jgi:cyclophilin family peptidyl-prolyl cis-trans isomerase
MRCLCAIARNVRLKPDITGVPSRSRHFPVVSGFHLRRSLRWTAVALAEAVSRTRNRWLMIPAFVVLSFVALQTAEAPPVFRVRLDTSKGPMVIEVHRDWAPNGADRFHELVRAGYYNDNRFFRVVAGRWAQFGINGDPKLATEWRGRPIPDDPRKQSNVRGSVAFAFAVPNGRTTQVYIALTDLSSPQDAQGFAPFGRVVSGMDVADALNSEYGETSGGGIRAGRQQPLFDGGNAYLDREFPRLDRIREAVVETQ